MMLTIANGINDDDEEEEALEQCLKQIHTRVDARTRDLRGTLRLREGSFQLGELFIRRQCDRSVECTERVTVGGSMMHR